MRIERKLYLDKLVSYIGNGYVKVVTGIRRCGKSYLLDPIFKEYLLDSGTPADHIIEVRLDAVSSRELLNAVALDKYLRSKITDNGRYFILLDEVQLVDGFEAVLNGLLALPNVEIYVTESNSRFLSSDIITEFRGRGIEIRVAPLSFAEYMEIPHESKEMALDEYYIYGGLPQVALASDPDAKATYLKTSTQNVYLNDIIERNGIRNPAELEELVKILASSVGSMTNPSSIAGTFLEHYREKAITRNTINEYIHDLEDAFMIERAQRYDVRGRKYIDSPFKYYFTDTGVRNSLLDYRQNDEVSHLMENVIYLELKRRGYSVDVGALDVKEDGQRKRLEIDFVASRFHDRVYIQSAYQIPDSTKSEQEQRPLLKVDDSFKKLIIVGDHRLTSHYDNGIATMNIYDFLLNQDSLSI